MINEILRLPIRKDALDHYSKDYELREILDLSICGYNDKEVKTFITTSITAERFIKKLSLWTILKVKLGLYNYKQEFSE